MLIKGIHDGGKKYVELDMNLFMVACIVYIPTRMVKLSERTPKRN